MGADFLYADLEPFLNNLVPERSPELVLMEQYAAEHDFPIIGPAAGQILYLVAKMIGAQSVFEMGSGYGYSTAWFARAVDENGGGTVHHTVWDEELSAMAKRHLAHLGYHATTLGDEARTKIHYHVAEAVATLGEQKETYDLIFNDIDKEAYPNTIEVVAERLRPGGAFITDNALWSGKILTGDNSEETTAIRKFTKSLTESPDWATTLLPVRDGLLLAIKR